MAASDTQLAEIREWIGDDPDDSTVQALWTAYGTVNRVSLSVLRRRRAALLADPAKLSIDGETSEDWTANLNALDSDIAALEGGVVTDTVDPDAAAGFATVGQMVRTDRPCR